MLKKKKKKTGSHVSQADLQLTIKIKSKINGFNDDFDFLPLTPKVGMQA